jgi:RNA polymerase sigma-70 factor (ECF subfamily)
VRDASLESASDADLLRAVASGDQAALEALYRRLGQRVFRYLVGILNGDAARAEDALSEAFFDVWRDAGAFREQSSVATWVFGIARHKALTLARRTQSTRYAEEVDEDYASAEEDVLTIMTESEAAEQVRQALSKLSPEHREVLELSLYHDFGYEQIATIAGCPVNTVKTRAFHARRELKRHLAALGAGDA